MNLAGRDIHKQNTNTGYSIQNMRILHTADWHLGKRLDRFSRIEEQREVLEEICRIADEEQVDAVVIAGDLFDHFTPPAEAQQLFYRTVHRLSKGGARPVVAIAGNHDMPERIEAPVPLAEANAIILLGFPQSVSGTFTSEGGVRVTRSEPGFLELALPGRTEPLRLLLTPYANELRLKTFLGGEQGLNDLLREHWQRLADTYCDERGVNLLMAHLYFNKDGSAAVVEDDGERSILHVGGAPPIPTSLIPRAIQYVALGHLHAHQVVDDETCPIVYSSSPLCYSFAEAGQQKRVVIIDAEPGMPVQARAVDLRSGLPLLRGEFDSTEAAVAWLQANPDSYVELTIRTDTWIDGAVRKTLSDAHERIVDLVPRITRPDAASDPGIPDDTDLGSENDMHALFSRYFRSKYGTEPSESILAIFREVVG